MWNTHKTRENIFNRRIVITIKGAQSGFLIVSYFDHVQN